MTARREPQYRVLGEQPLVGLEPVEAEPLVRMVERQLELAAPAGVRAARRLGCEPQANLPQQRAPREVADARERPVPLPLDDRRGRGLLTPVAQEAEPHPYPALPTVHHTSL